MKERPILMTPENAQKCFEGTKTQTRRIIKPQPPNGATIWQSEGIGDTWQVRRCDPWHSIKCPYGKVGDRLWIREKWEAGYNQSCSGPILVAAFNQQQIPAPDAPEGVTDWCLCWKTKPAIRMPRWACRTVVEITEIRVQRLQEITFADILAEGISADVGFGMAKLPNALSREFVALWESINGAGSWAENPWVWALTFKKV